MKKVKPKIEKPEESVALMVVENRFSLPLEYAKLLVDLAWDRKVSITFYRGPRRAVWWTRRKMINHFLTSREETHLLFLDTDVIPKDPNFVDKLLAHKADLVSGYYCTTDGKPVNYKGVKGYMGKGLEEVEYFSMGFSLIKREVLEKVGYPEPTPIEKLDADSEFCWKARLTGYKVLQDFDQKAFHLLRSII